MAVEAPPVNLLPSHFIISNTRDFSKSNQGTTTIVDSIPTATTTGLWPYTAETTTATVKPESSGLTAATRKRTRPAAAVGFFDHQQQQRIIMNSQIQQHQSEIDRFIAIHTEKMRMEMEERKKRQSGMMVRAIEERVVEKLKEKDEEMERMGKLNWVLQERVKRLCIENQLWRDLAETNEAAVNSLRTNLEQVLLTTNSGTADDAESCCGSNTNNNDGTEAESGGGGGGRDGRCRKCRAAETRVLVLPCRHLCLCTVCGSTLHFCPLCNSPINATLHVNFS